MKKLLLLLMALTLFAPPRAHAQETDFVTQDINGGTLHGYLGHSGIGTTTSPSSTRYNNTGVKASHNEGVYTIASFLTTKPTTNNGYGQGGYMYGELKGTTSDRVMNLVAIQALPKFNNGESKVIGADKFQILFETKTPGTGVDFHNTSSSEIVIPEGTKLHFRTLGGKIKEIRINIYKNGIFADSKYGTIAQTASWTSEDATITPNTATGYVFINPKSEDCTELSVDLGEDKQWVFKGIYFDWFPLKSEELPVPDDPSKIEVNGKEYVADAEGVIRVPIEEKIFFKVPLPKGASNVFLGSTNIVTSTTADPTTCKLGDEVHTGAFNFSVTAGPSFEVSSLLIYPATSGYKLLPVYDMNALTAMNANGFITANYKQVMFLRSWNPRSYSEKTIKVVFTRDLSTQLKGKTPEIDVDNLPEGCSWDEATKTYSYNKIGGKIRFKPIQFGYVVAYDLTGANTMPSTPTYADVTPDNIEFSFDLPVEPVHGQRTKIIAQVRDLRTSTSSSTGATSSIVFYAKYTGGEVEGGATPTIQAPLVSYGSDALTTTLAGGVTGFINNDLKLTIESMAGEDKTEDFQYQFAEAANGVWAQTPDATKWQSWPADGLSVSATGRLFVREVKDGYESQTAYRDFSKITTKVTDLALTDVNDGDVITLNDENEYNIVGVYKTVKPGSETGELAGTTFVYLTDKAGRAIKMIVEGENPNVEAYKRDNYHINNVTGVVRGIESGLPELWITTSAMDYSTFLPGPVNTPYFTSTVKEVTEIERADFNKKVVLRNVTFNKADNTLKTSTGNVVKPYARLLTDPTFAVIMGLSEGPTYSVEGFVGYANGDMVLLPTGAIATPKLLAPNPITANDEDKANGYITVNVVSDVVTITPDIIGVRPETALIYSKNGGTQNTLSEIVNGNAKIEITADDYVDNVCTLQVSYNRKNIGGEWVEIRFVKKEAEAVASIADFKAKYPDDADAKDGKIYRYEGMALVREITPKYLYLRDVKEDGTEFGKDELSAHSILLYNENGWEAPVAMNVREDEAPRKLEKGDIITNFALVASRTELQNLRGDNSGYARTLRRIAGDPVEYEAQVKDILTEDTPFSETDRMVRYQINNVTVTKSLDGDKEVFTLDMAGSPVLNIGNVFEIRKGFSTAYLAGTLYNFDGVVLRNGDKGNYAVALIDFTVAGDKKPLTAPQITIEGDGIDGKDFLTTAKVKMTSADNATIYYTLDNTDPRRSDSREIYTDPIEISATTVVKAFASTPGEIPSDMTEATFTRTANERRYIVNFLDQAEAGVPYHFAGTARVVAMGGDYIFVRGTQGHYLPINIKEAERPAGLKVGSYVSDFVMEAHIISSGEKEIVRGAHITAEYAPLFATPSDTKPAELEKAIEMEPDVVTTITAANARRYVKIMGVRLQGAEFEADGDEATHDTDWTLTTNKGEGEGIHVNHNILEPIFDWDKADQTAAAYYNITGFAMLDEKEGIELWPLEVEKVKSSEPVKAEFIGNVTVDPVTADGITTVEFYPFTTVKLTCPIADPQSATIYYNVSPTPIVPGPDTKWNVYAQDFSITSDSYITMYATAPGYEQSAYTHIEAKVGTPAGTVAFDVAANPGTTTVKMTAAAGASIFYTTDALLAQENWTPYTSADGISFTEATTLWAYAREGKKIGAVSSMYVMVMPEQTTAPDPAKVSGKVKIELDTESDLSKVTITLSPAAPLASGTYQIWYAFNPTAECIPGEGGNMTPYTAPIERAEGGRLVAILIENGKTAGEPADQYITLIPTDIDGVDADRKEDAVSVEGSHIVAPRGSEVFDITGRRVNPTGLRSGIYIVRTPGGKSVKVKVD